MEYIECDCLTDCGPWHLTPSIPPTHSLIVFFDDELGVCVSISEEPSCEVLNEIDCVLKLFIRGSDDNKISGVDVVSEIIREQFDDEIITDEEAIISIVDLTVLQ